MRVNVVKWIVAVAVLVTLGVVVKKCIETQDPPGTPPIISLKPKLPGGGTVHQTEWSETGSPLPPNGLYELSTEFQKITEVEWYVDGELDEDFTGVVFELEHIGTGIEHFVKLHKMGGAWTWLVMVDGANASFTLCDSIPNGNPDCTESAISPPGALTGKILSAKYLDGSAVPANWELRITLEE